MSSSSIRFDLLEKDPSRSKAQETDMRFTDLPAEIRDEIYRYLLATDYVRKRRKNPEFREFGGVALGYHHPEHIYGGCLRCQNVWIERSCYSLNILRVSRQIYQESSQIFSKNSWIFVRVNRSLFASHLKGHGFNAFRINSTQGMKVSILALTVRFPTHFPPSRLGWGSSTFVMSTTDAGRLQRALSTATGLVKMKFTFIARHDFPKESNPITEAFLDLRGVGIASVCGPGSRHSLGMMARIISTPLVSTSVHKDAYLELAQGRVRNSLSEAQAYRTNQEWHKTAAKCKTSMVYIIDFFSVYFTGIRRISTQWSLLYDTYEILLTMLVEATFWIGDYDSVVSISEHVRGVNSRRKSTPEGSNSTNERGQPSYLRSLSRTIWKHDVEDFGKSGVRGKPPAAPSEGLRKADSMNGGLYFTTWKFSMEDYGKKRRLRTAKPLGRSWQGLHKQ